MAKLTVALATAFLLTITSATAASGQTQMPLIESQYNCSAAQAAFDGRPQPVVLGSTATVQLAAECFLVVGVVATPGERLTLTYLSGQYDQINLAFYQPVARPGQAFGDAVDVRFKDAGRPGEDALDRCGGKDRAYQLQRPHRSDAAAFH